MTFFDVPSWKTFEVGKITRVWLKAVSAGRESQTCCQEVFKGKVAEDETEGHGDTEGKMI